MDPRDSTLLYGKLLEIADLEEGRRDFNGILERAAAAMRDVLDASVAYAAAGPEAHGPRLICAAIGGERQVTTDTWRGPGPLGRVVLDSMETQVWPDGEETKPSAGDLAGLENAGAWMGTPIALADRPSGLLVAVRGEDRPFTDEEREMGQVMAAQASLALANLRAFQELESLAVTDDLTRTYNYRFLKAALRREVERASRYSQVFSVLMLDVDHLKKFNEAHGHLEGSELLRRLAAILAASSRAIDLVAKYGGDEFMIILPQTRTEGAEVMASRICKAVEENTFAHCTSGDITVSIGLASFPKHGTTMESLLAAADTALFEAKRTGRNKVVIARGPGRPGRVLESN